ncbi:MAG: stalk domain-containing protein, partial [Bacillota bacterium]
VYINGVKQSFDVNPTVEKNVTLVPMRAVFEELGAEVSWKADTKQIKAVKDKTTIKLYLNSRMAYVNYEIFLLDVAPKTVKGRTLVPLRFVSEALGAVVNWDGKNNVIYIYSKEEPENNLPTGLVLDKNAAVIAEGEYVYLTAELLPESLPPTKITWTSDDESVATVGSMGRVYGKKEGTALIKAETANGLSDTCVVKVTEAKNGDSDHDIDFNWGSGNVSDSKYYKNLNLKNYTAVTGEKCIFSIDSDWIVTFGFADDSVVFYYDYREAAFQKYYDYLISEGWTEALNLNLQTGKYYLFKYEEKIIEYRYNNLAKQVIIKIINDGSQ